MQIIGEERLWMGRRIKELVTAVMIGDDVAESVATKPGSGLGLSLVLALRQCPGKG